MPPLALTGPHWVTQAHREGLCSCLPSGKWGAVISRLPGGKWGSKGPDSKPARAHSGTIHRHSPPSALTPSNYVPSNYPKLVLTPVWPPESLLTASPQPPPSARLNPPMDLSSQAAHAGP